MKLKKAVEDLILNPVVPALEMEEITGTFLE